MRGLPNEGAVRTATLARAFHVARATLYDQPRAHPHWLLRADEPRARGHVRRVALAHPSFGYRRVWSVLRCPEGRFINRKRVVSLAGERCLLVEHHSTAEAVHAVGETLEKPDMAIESLRAGPRFRTESIKLYAGGRRMEVKLVVGRRSRLDSANEIYPAVRVFNSLNWAWAVRNEVLGVRISCCNQLHAGAKDLSEFREIHLSYRQGTTAPTPDPASSRASSTHLFPSRCESGFLVEGSVEHCFGPRSKGPRLVRHRAARPSNPP